VIFLLSGSDAAQVVPAACFSCFCCYFS